MGLAKFTVKVRPSSSLPANISIAFLASSTVLISTKPKPLERPESRSVMTLADSTVPAAAKASARLCQACLYEKDPTNNRLFSSCMCLLSFAKI